MQASSYRLLLLPLHNLKTGVLAYKSVFMWCIDWAFAGTYPLVFEPATTKGQNDFPEFAEQLLQHIEHDKREMNHLEYSQYAVVLCLFG